MDIRTWQKDRIMQLPDWCFGRRWPVSVSSKLTGAAAVFAVSPIELPRGFVIWELLISTQYASGISAEVALAVGNRLPADDAEFDRQKLLFPEVESLNAVRGGFDTSQYISLYAMNTRTLIETTDNILIGRFIRRVGSAVGLQAILTISRIPTEVPDWLLKR